MRLTYTMELVLAIAAGMALVRVNETPGRNWEETRTYPRLIRYWTRVTDFVEPFCLGLVLVEGTALWVESFRRRAPTFWGFGRLSWSITFAVALLSLFETVVLTAGGCLRNDEATSIGLVAEDLRSWVTSGFGTGGNALAYGLIGLLVTALVGRCPRDPSPDAREWSGRFLVVALVARHVLDQTLDWYRMLG